MPRIVVTGPGLTSFVDQTRARDHWAGFVSTAPHKRRLTKLVDTLTHRAEQLGCCNVVRRDLDGSLHGDITDGLAAMHALAEQDANLAGKRVGLVGCGAAGLAIAFAALQQGASAIFLVDLDNDVEQRAVARLRAAARPPGDDEAAESISIQRGLTARLDVLVNASPLGGNPSDDSPFTDDAIRHAEAVIDVVTRPTQLALAGRLRGIPTVTGQDMAAAHVGPVLHHLHSVINQNRRNHAPSNQPAS